MKKLVSLLFCVIFLIGRETFAGGILSETEFLKPAHWIGVDASGDRLILTADGIEKLNEKIRLATPTVVDLEKFVSTVKIDWLKEQISKFDLFTGPLFLDSKPITEGFKKEVIYQTNLDKIRNGCSYGVILCKSSLRNLPTMDALYGSAIDSDFDLVHDTMLDPCEAVVVLHTSANGNMYYVQSANYRGWVSRFNIGLTDRTTWAKFANPKKYLVVTSDVFEIPMPDKNLSFQMGARIPYFEKFKKKFSINLPGRDREGRLVVVGKEISLLPGLNDGYVPYTSNNIIRLAMKYAGKPYGWGNTRGGVDSSGLLQCVYRTMGIFLPRNADEQMITYGLHTKINGFSEKERFDVLDKIVPGTSLFTKDHGMIYLGKSSGIPYVLHALTSYYESGKKISPMQVVVSDLNLKKSNGQPYVMELAEAVRYR